MGRPGPSQAPGLNKKPGHGAAAPMNVFGGGAQAGRGGQAPARPLRSPPPQQKYVRAERRRSRTPPPQRRTGSSPQRQRGTAWAAEPAVENGSDSGRIVSFLADKAFGFIKPDDTRRIGDTYFHKTLLPENLQNASAKELEGRRVEFSFYTKDGKDRADTLTMLEGRSRNGRGNQEEDGDSRRRGNRGGARHKPLPGSRRTEAPPRDEGPLIADRVDEMTAFLEERGGVMDYGRFTCRFSGLKKPQLSPHFDLVPEVDGQIGGRWQIMIKGVEPMTPEQRAEQEVQEREMLSKENEEREEATFEEEVAPVPLEPSDTLRLSGRISKWDERTGTGVISVKGWQEVDLDEVVLPPDLQGRADLNLLGCEVTFSANITEDGVNALDVHALLQPDGKGGWQLKRV